VDVDFADLDGWTFLQTRTTDDLPVEIKGKAKWTIYLDAGRSCYELQGNPVEFVNNRTWVHILWLQQSARYGTKESYHIAIADHALGSHKRPYTEGTPIEFFEPEHTGRSTQEKEEQSPTESRIEQETKGEPYVRHAEPSMGTQVEHVHAATARTYITPFAGGSNTGPAGQPGHFGTSAPGEQAPTRNDPPETGGGWPNRNNPGGDPDEDPNPMPGGPPGGGGGGAPGGPVLANPLAPGEGGGLDGAPPKPFDGDRSKTSQFIKEFELFKMINFAHRKMRTPATRVGLALSYIKGDKVNDWVYNQVNQLSVRVYGDSRNPPTHNAIDEALWEDFVTDFRNAFIHTASKEEAFVQLQRLTMKDVEIDLYTAKFEGLLRQAEWERSSAGSIEMFKDGLPSWLTRRIIFRDHRPYGMNGWQVAAREEVERELEVRATLGS
jgi:hypothetical protein